MRHVALFPLSWLALLLLASSAAAAAPPTIHYQGLALDAGGVPIDVPIDVKFTLYDDPLAGASLWEETHTGVLPASGVFAVLLGSIEPIVPGTFTGDGRWLQIEIDGEVLDGRQPITSVPWALGAGCEPGDLRQCYGDAVETIGVGECRSGLRSCDEDGRWGECNGAVVPTAESCVDLADNDCDGAVNEGCLVCGNLSVDPPEECDDGNVIGGDGCSAVCRHEVCGNGFVDVDEQCDDGNVAGGDGCSATCDFEAIGQIAPPDAGFNTPLDIPLDATRSVLDFVSHPLGDTQDRVRFSVTGMNPSPVASGGQARLVISVTCFGQNPSQIELFHAGQTYSCGDTIVDRIVTADTDTGQVNITAVGGVDTYVQWVLTGTATRTN